MEEQNEELDMAFDEGDLNKSGVISEENNWNLLDDPSLKREIQKTNENQLQFSCVLEQSQKDGKLSSSKIMPSMQSSIHFKLKKDTKESKIVKQDEDEDDRQNLLFLMAQIKHQHPMKKK